MRAAVSGGDGFIGQHLISWLLASGDEVSASTLEPGPDLRTLTPREAEAVDWRTANVLDADALSRLVRDLRPDCLYHLAGFSSGARAREAPAEALRVNAGGTLNLLEAVIDARRADPSFDPTILLVSSADAYGPPPDPTAPFREEDPLRPATSYGVSKAAMEMVAHAYRAASSLRIIVVRLFPLLGPGQGSDFVLPSVCLQVARIAAGAVEPVLHTGNLYIERDFTDVCDGVRGLRLLAEPGTAEMTYNLCSGQTLPIGRLVEWVLEEAGVEVELRPDPERLRPEEPLWVCGDPERLEKATGWAPKRSLRAAVRDTYTSIARSHTEATGGQ
jgi:GDP-4-dehydro-6-deoxy-D-mannose reductase